MMVRHRFMIIGADLLPVTSLRVRTVTMISSGQLRRATTFTQITAMNPSSLRPCDRHDRDEQKHLAQ